MNLTEKIENRIRSEKKKHEPLMKDEWIKVCSIKLAHDFEFLLAAQKKAYQKQAEVIREQGKAQLVEVEMKLPLKKICGDIEDERAFGRCDGFNSCLAQVKKILKESKNG